jgi:choline dehydrogenase/5-(hydroxymethyl)furfural/furfural oxidase
MRDGVKRSLELLRSGSFDAALARIAIDMTARGLEELSDDRAIDAWLMEMIGDTGHSAAPAGWARPTTRGLWSTPGGGCSASRIWVAEASVFRAVPLANTNLPTIEAAERLSDFLREPRAAAPTRRPHARRRERRRRAAARRLGCTGSNPGSKLSATATNAEQLEPALDS